MELFLQGCWTKLFGAKKGLARIRVIYIRNVMQVVRHDICHFAQVTNSTSLNRLQKIRCCRGKLANKILCLCVTFCRLQPFNW